MARAAPGRPADAIAFGLDALVGYDLPDVDLLDPLVIVVIAVYALAAALVGLAIRGVLHLARGPHGRLTPSSVT